MCICQHEINHIHHNTSDNYRFCIKPIHFLLYMYMTDYLVRTTVAYIYIYIYPTTKYDKEANQLYVYTVVIYIVRPNISPAF